MRLRWHNSRREWVAVIYLGLIVGHEIAYRFGVNVALPVMLLLLLSPFVGLYLLSGPPPQLPPSFPPVCARCGYDLRARSGRCPECGAPATNSTGEKA